MGQIRQADAEAVYGRLQVLYTLWNDGSRPPPGALSFRDAHCFIIGAGTFASDTSQLDPAEATVRWLLAGEKLTNTLVICFSNEVVWLTSEKKTRYLFPLLQCQTQRTHLVSGRRPGVPPISLQQRSPESITMLLDRLSKFGERSLAAVYTPDKGSLLEEWCSAAAARKIFYFDMTHELSYVATVRARSEIEVIGEAAVETLRGVEFLCSQCVKHYDAGEQASLPYMLDTLEKTSKLKWPFGYNPLVESGGNYSVKPRDKTAIPPSPPPHHHHPTTLSYDAIIISMGLRRRGLHTNVCRTLLFDPEPHILRAYTLLKAVRKRVLHAIKPGVPASEIYLAAKDEIHRQAPHLWPHFVKSAGHSIGFVFRDKAVQLTERCSAKLLEGQVLAVRLGFAGLSRTAHPSEEDIKPRVKGLDMPLRPPVSLLLADMVSVSYNRDVHDSTSGRARRARCWTPLSNTLHVQLRLLSTKRPSPPLPAEVLEIIFGFLDCKSLGAASRACRLWSTIGWHCVNLAAGRDMIRWKIDTFAAPAAVGMRNSFIQSDGFHTAAGGTFAPSDLGRLATPIRVLGSFKQQRHQAIRKLILEGCRVGEYIQPKEFDVLRNMPFLRHLDCNHIKIGTMAAASYIVKILAAVLRRPDCRLETLELAGASLSGNHVETLMSGLVHNTSLTTLRLQENPIGDRGARALASAFARRVNPEGVNAQGVHNPERVHNTEGVNNTTVTSCPLGPVGVPNLLHRGTLITSEGASVLQGVLDSGRSIVFNAPVHHNPRYTNMGVEVVQRVYHGQHRHGIHAARYHDRVQDHQPLDAEDEDEEDEHDSDDSDDSHRDNDADGHADADSDDASFDQLDRHYREGFNYDSFDEEDDRLASSHYFERMPTGAGPAAGGDVKDAMQHGVAAASSVGAQVSGPQQAMHHQSGDGSDHDAGANVPPPVDEYL
eukprot:m.186202 g.186202  ORF g.186202 m.186202 type:complete len:938 (+) comp16691_c0_seq1:224-3037(+)